MQTMDQQRQALSILHFSRVDCPPIMIGLFLFQRYCIDRPSTTLADQRQITSTVAFFQYHSGTAVLEKGHGDVGDMGNAHVSK